ncbi:hypothetical protein R1flu_003256 [Riccia fluitans]|uniref:Uncharacterized protein n=1 Tax=Riccia fluitans TaxID=41844 RepID=A0ABD1Y8J8_9MARC
MELMRTELRAIRREHNLLTIPEEPRATDLVWKLAEELCAAKRGADGWQHLVAENDEELERLKAELEKTNADWRQKAWDLKAKIYQVRDDAVKREETARWKRNEEKIAGFVHEVADLRKELLAKDAKEGTPETTTPSSPDIQLVVFRPQEEVLVAREIDTSGPFMTEIWERNCQMERLKGQLEKA